MFGAKHPTPEQSHTLTPTCLDICLLSCRHYIPIGKSCYIPTISLKNPTASVLDPSINLYYILIAVHGGNLAPP